MKNIQRLDIEKYITITVFACHKQGQFFFSGAHQDIMIYRAEKQEVEQIQTDGIWLGIIDNLNEILKDAELTLNIGDTMLLFTDGIIEARNKSDDMDLFGEKHLAELFSESGNKSPENIKTDILKALEGYEFVDDATMVILRRNE